MPRFLIKHGFTLRAAKKMLQSGIYYTTDVETEIEELREVYAPHGACEELLAVEAKKPAKKKKDEEIVPDPLEDLSTVNGVGAATLAKLEEAGIKKKSELAVALKDKADDMKELFGANFEKIAAQFVPAAA